jgi:hypothetical protein
MPKDQRPLVLPLPLSWMEQLPAIQSRLLEKVLPMTRQTGCEQREFQPEQLGMYEFQYEPHQQHDLRLEYV